MINLFSPLRTVMIFIVFGIIWIFTTDNLLLWLFGPASSRIWVGQHLKGTTFMLICGTLLYWLLRKYLTSLHHSENAYIRIFKESPHAMWIYSKKDLRFLLVNDAAVNIYGYSRQEFMLLRMSDLNPQEDDLRHVKKDGSLMYVQVQSFETSYGGEPAEVASAMDVTDKYLADEALHQQEKLLNTIINSSEELIWAVNADKEFIVFNNEFHDTIQKFTGTDIKLGDKLSMVEGELEYQRWRKYYEKSLLGQKLVKEDIRELAGFGISYSEITFNPIVFEGDIIGVACFARNITERKQQEIKLGKAVERYEIVSLATNDVIWDWDLATNKIIWNSNLQRLFGHDATNEDISWWKKMVHPDDYAQAVFTLEEVIRTRLTQWAVEYRFKNAEGEYRYVNDRGYVIYNDEGLPYRVIGAMQDIHEKKKFVEELKKVAHMSSHGMRRPVASMLGLVNLLNKEDLAHPDNAPLLVHVETLANEMDVILHEVADKCNAIFMVVEKE
ncbi:PAS domain S-box protein [Chitinophaga sp. SYP-B3965]|uniref:PAS domain-containing protein n=1 Tax=Chitinophaga sp. SYP-B3965 TaxID=2663120 RepID=UPI001299E950|nr:PAS domain S-box protein [Chitinophaga sp. SYP-B3965]MRG44940.1 PAS domain S-box protein [Chitinophaga sp. SYP-B3965]